jgi:putative FmdB family regulatory protein
MPIYEYACKACGHEFEREQRISDAPIKKCPSCGALRARRQISRTSFVLKGGGWYSDLYGAPPAAKPGAEDAASGKDVKDAKPAADAGEAKAPAAGGSEAGPGSDSPDKPPKKGGKGKKAAAA